MGQLLTLMSYDIDRVLLDSLNRGIMSRGQVVRAFEESDEDAEAIE